MNLDELEEAHRKLNAYDEPFVGHELQRCTGLINRAFPALLALARDGERWRSQDRAEVAMLDEHKPETTTRAKTDMTPPIGNDGKPWPRTFDAQAWAKAFNQTLVQLGYQPHDEGWLIGWFANAIMRGFDEANWRVDAAMKEREK